MEKIKQIFKKVTEGEQGKNILLVIIIILVGSGSFELGRLSSGTSGSGVKVEYQEKALNQLVNAENGTEALKNIAENQTSTSESKKVTTASKNNFFASSRGHKYYPLGCSAGKTIKQENRIYFATKEDAERAGYTLSDSCR